VAGFTKLEAVSRNGVVRRSDRAFCFAYVTLKQKFAILRFGTLPLHEVALVMLSPPKFVRVPYSYNSKEDPWPNGLWRMKYNDYINYLKNQI
jgi:hypothetical protein